MAAPTKHRNSPQPPAGPVLADDSPVPGQNEARRPSGDSPLSALLAPVDFSTVPGWHDDDHAAAFAAFLKSAAHLAAAGRQAPKTRGHGVSGAALVDVARHALSEAGGGAGVDGDRARAFFERRFRPAQVDADGFLTAYFEPEAPASRIRTPEFPVPLYRRPDDLVDIGDDNRPAGWDPEIRFARATASGPQPYADRAAIEAGALDGRGLELAFVADPVTAFFIHVQGSARLRLTDGGMMRIAYAAKSGHPYTSIAKRAVDRGDLHPDRCGKAELEAWLRADPGRGRKLMQENRSFIFFREVTDLSADDGPVGAAGVSLTPGRSLAVDRRWTTFHTPVWVTADMVPDPDAATPPGRFARLMIAQDTGSAIVGPARGDLFLGSGDRAGDAAGTVRTAGTMTLLIPVEGA